MAVIISHLLAILPLLLITSPFQVTLPTSTLFQNTLKRWGVTVLSHQDRSERWARFVKAQASVEFTTSGVLLESLNYFTILNDEEWERIGKPMFEHSNINMSFPMRGRIEQDHFRRRKRAIPESITFWEDGIGLTSVQDQQSCGSCWSFPVTGAIEAKYRQTTGDNLDFAEQFFVDCAMAGSGCDGGNARDGYQLIREKQYVPIESDHPYTGSYSGCSYTDKLASGEGNGMTKAWFANFLPLSATEEGVLGGLLHSPVAFAGYISYDFQSYSGGDYEDVDCLKDSLPHAMLLVGYTPTTLRVKASYGTGWGVNGYVTYKRGSSYLTSCNFYKDGIAIYMFARKDLEYKFCYEEKKATYSQCKDSCEAMNTADKTGWSLATVPTWGYNQKLMEMAVAKSPGEKSDETFNLFWMGFQDLSKNSVFSWHDGYSSVYYISKVKGTGNGVVGTISKITGDWKLTTKAGATYRGFCSRAVNCWNMENYINDGVVTFDKADRSEGTKATIACNEGFVLEDGASEFTCKGGLWLDDVNNPSSSSDFIVTRCNSGETSGTCAKPTVDSASITPVSDTIESGATYTATCNSGFTISGSGVMTCTNGQLSTAPTCNQDSGVTTCSKPVITEGTVSPASDTINSGATYTATCNSGFTISGSGVMTCTNGQLSTAPTCNQDSGVTTCSKPVITAATVSPASATINSGATYTATCNGGFTISGSGVMTCTNGQLSTAPTCIQDSGVTTCTKPDITEGTVSPALDTIESGAKYTVTCNDGFILSGDAQLTCDNGALSTAPTCTREVNMNCAAYEVVNGLLKEERTSFTTDQVATVQCGFGYTLAGTNPRVCAVAGWASEVQTCDKNENCIALTDPMYGSVDCTARNVDSSCTLECDVNYISLSQIKEVTCLSTLLWSHQTADNSLAEFGPCVEKKVPEARILSVEMSLNVDFCRTNQEKTDLIAAFETFINGVDSIDCLKSNKCTMESTVCENVNSQSKVTFELKQTADMTDTDILNSADLACKELVENDAVSFELTTSKKRATTTIKADSNSYVSEVDTTCPDGLAKTGDTCFTCPAGYKTSPNCGPCEAGSYNPTAGAASCTQCSGDKTTYTTGATISSQCVDICTVPQVSNGAFNVEVGFPLKPTDIISLTCDSGFETKSATIACTSADASTKCTVKDPESGGGSSTTTVVVVVVVVALLLIIIGLIVIWRLKVSKQDKSGGAYELPAMDDNPDDSNI